MPSSQIISTDESVRLDIVHSVYKNKVVYEKMPEGDLFPNKKETFHKQIRVKKWFKKEAIISVEEYVTRKNKIAKSRSIVFDKYSSRFYVTFHRVEDIISNLTIQPYKNQIGFTYDNKVHPTRPQVCKYKKRG
jgi:hypothetical protein